MLRSTSRRSFLRTSAVGATALAFPASSYARIVGANERLNVAFVGCGGIGNSQAVGPAVANEAGCPAFCDADSDRMGKAREH